MKLEPIRILLVDATTHTPAWVSATATAGREPPSQVRSVSGIEAATTLLHEEAFDLVLFELGGAESLTELRSLRKHARLQPLIALGKSADERLAMHALAAAAQDYLVMAETDAETFARAVRFAVARHRFQASLDEHRARRAGERELGGLEVLSGPPPAPVSGRSLGHIAFTDRVTRVFSELVDQYADAIEIGVQSQAMRVEGNLAESLSAFADRLGLLGAGPRDVIDVHKTALKKKLEGASVAKARAYIEESRLLLLQVMGYLALFYRNLSWGRSRIGGPSAGSAEASSHTGIAAGKTSL